MKLIEFDGQDFKIADEALLIRPIRELLRKDKSARKEDFWRQMSFLWFMCDPRSTYQYIIDEDERAKEIMAQESLGDDWTPSELLKEAMDIYKKHTVTTQSLFLENMRTCIDDMSVTLKNLGMRMRSLDGTEDAKSGLTIDKALMTMSKISKDIPSLSESFAQAEKAMLKDFAEEGKTRGTVQKAIGEDI